jgi:hypothetical protein
MIRVGMPLQAGRWRGHVAALYRGHAVSIADDCYFDFKVHRLADIVVAKGIALAPRCAATHRADMATS